MLKMRIILSIIITILCATLLTGFTIRDVFDGIERKTYNEMHLPNLQWINEMGFHLQGGYDIHSGSFLIDGAFQAQMFENFQVKIGAMLETPNATDSTQFQLSIGAKGYLTRAGSVSQQSYREANRIIMDRKIDAVGFYYQFIRESLRQNTIDPTQSIIDRIDYQRSQVDQAYALSQLRTLSGIERGELEIPSIDEMILTPIDEQDLVLSILNYLHVRTKADMDAMNDWYLTINSRIRHDQMMLLAGVGYDLGFTKPTEYTTDQQMDEVQIRKMKLDHQVLYENIPLLQQEIQQIRDLKARLTQDQIRQSVTQEEVDQVIQYEGLLTQRFHHYLLEAKAIEMKLQVMRGE